MKIRKQNLFIPLFVEKTFGARLLANASEFYWVAIVKLYLYSSPHNHFMFEFTTFGDISVRAWITTWLNIRFNGWSERIKMVSLYFSFAWASGSLATYHRHHRIADERAPKKTVGGKLSTNCRWEKPKPSKRQNKHWRVRTHRILKYRFKLNNNRLYVCFINVIETKTKNTRNIMNDTKIKSSAMKHINKAASERRNKIQQQQERQRIRKNWKSKT